MWTLDYQPGKGLYLPQVGLWLDPRRAVPQAFVSHAHFDHMARHDRVILSHGTAALMRARMPSQRLELPLRFGESHALDPSTELRLYPAGHITGSSQCWLKRHGQSLLYTGDFKLRPGLSSEPCEMPQANILIMETTFGLPRYVFPPADEVMSQIRLFVQSCLADNIVPVLLAYSLGKSQELLMGLASTGIPLMVHPQVFKMTQVCESLGWSFPSCKVLDEKKVAGHIVIQPPQAKAPSFHCKTAMITGWALDSRARYQYRSDAAFALSDHCDFPSLLEAVEMVSPQRVYTVHGFAREFAATLRKKGIEAWALGRANQLELPLD